MFENFTDKAEVALDIAQLEARSLGQNYVGSELLLLGLIAQGQTLPAKLIQETGLTLRAVQEEVERVLGKGTGATSNDIPMTPRVKRIIEQALRDTRHWGHDSVGPEHLFLALLADKDGAAVKVLSNLNVDTEAMCQQVFDLLSAQVAVPAGNRNGQKDSAANAGALAAFATDLTRRAADGNIDPVVGRESEVERVIQILGRRSKNNPVLVGAPGVGKTAIAEGLAQRIIDGNVPEFLVDKSVMSLDVGSLVAGTQFRGAFEERLQQVVAEVQKAGNVILVIDEIHTLVGAGALDGGMDAANMLKPALARGELQCVGATTLDEYRKYIEKDAALERRFQPVTVDEPSVAETVEILRGIRGRYEQHHCLTISDAALQAAATLSDRYISDRFLPDKAIDLIDEAGSRVRLRHSKASTSRDYEQELRQIADEKSEAVKMQDFETAGQLRDREMDIELQLQQAQAGEVDAQVVVEAEDIAQIVSSWNGVPVNQLTASESAMLLKLEETLHERLIGQEDAVKAVSRAIRRARVGLRNPNRPIASFIFCGPTGVGKTELTKALAASVFGSEDAMVRLDMSEYMESQSVSKLIGSPPGYVGYGEGGQLTEAVRRKPYTLLLLDEIEKAHPDVFNLLLQLLEDGRLTDSQGRVVDFKNTLVVMTSNLGARAIEKKGEGMGFAIADVDEAKAQYERTDALVKEALQQSFRPEFINRLDDIIVFRQLDRDEVKQIAGLLLRDVSSRLTERGISLEVTDAFKERLIAEGYDPNYGARPLRRAISRLVEDVLAEAILSEQIESGDTAILDVDDEAQVRVLPRRVPALVGAPQH